jgi:2-keto-4-pentenoate hydratase/2-oxohepta-3-ene-1,7-dioic acid hydratase in catechol pathway
MGTTRQLNHGDVYEVEVEGVPVLRTPVIKAGQ